MLNLYGKIGTIALQIGKIILTQKHKEGHFPYPMEKTHHRVI